MPEQRDYEKRIRALISLREGTSRPPEEIEETVSLISERILERQGFLSTEDLAFLLDTNEWTVAKWCREGKVPARKIASVWHIGLDGMFYEKQR